ncbi:inorganic diphosphatase [Methylomonas sp. MK1]|uniref:inorganic diphosphatase n=1 Tax=Methylomonas sp. MK1 TaxID=1131552 RepID=UPI00037B4530|nr:inorganic diphosphatase [Methylomonas sp. MK1]
MSFMQVAAGGNIPFEINVVVEIPAFSDPVKYEVDKHTGALTVDRFMGTAMQYPCNYGYIPQTLSEDGDPVDVMIITPAPLLSGCVINCRPVGVLKMIDEAGPDPKLLAVPVSRLTPFYNHVADYKDLQPDKLAKITHFFQHYKDLEEGKWVCVEGWGGIEDARQEILASVGRYKTSHSSRR